MFFIQTGNPADFATLWWECAIQPEVRGRVAVTGDKNHSLRCLWRLPPPSRSSSVMSVCLLPNIQRRDWGCRIRQHTSIVWRRASGLGTLSAPAAFNTGSNSSSSSSSSTAVPVSVPTNQYPLCMSASLLPQYTTSASNSQVAPRAHNTWPLSSPPGATLPHACTRVTLSGCHWGRPAGGLKDTEKTWVGSVMHWGGDRHR